MILTLPDNWSDHLGWLIGFNQRRNKNKKQKNFSSLHGRTRFATGSRGVATKVSLLLFQKLEDMGAISLNAYTSKRWLLGT